MKGLDIKDMFDKKKLKKKQKLVFKDLIKFPDHK